MVSNLKTVTRFDDISNLRTASRFDEIYDSTRKDVLALIVAKCGKTADISDIFQETYVELYKLLIKRGVDYSTLTFDGLSG